MITLSEDIKQQLWKQATEAYPYEGCGLLLGHINDECTLVEAVRPAKNVWPDEEERKVRFRIDEAEWLAIELEAMAQDLDIVGIYHSHPDHPAVASPRDLAWAAFKGYSYLITEVREGQPVISRSWLINNDNTGFDEEKVVIKISA